MWILDPPCDCPSPCSRPCFPVGMARSLSPVCSISEKRNGIVSNRSKTHSGPHFPGSTGLIFPRLRQVRFLSLGGRKGFRNPLHCTHSHKGHFPSPSPSHCYNAPRFTAFTLLTNL